MYIELEMKKQYGKRVFHPLSADAYAVALIAGTKTVTEEKIKICVQMLDADVQLKIRVDGGLVPVMKNW